MTTSLQSNAQTVATPTVLRAKIDTDLDPLLPSDGTKIEFHAKGGKVAIEKKSGELWIDGKKFVLHRSECQQNGKVIVGYQLREELSGKPLPNACVLDFLLEHTDFIPESWKKDEAGNAIYIFFWGTIYRDSDGSLCVRFLSYRRMLWEGNVNGLDRDWRDDGLAALLEETAS